MSEKMTPEIRFREFQGEWEKILANDIFGATSDKNHPELPVLSASQVSGMIRRDESNYEVYHDPKNENTYKRVLPGQFVIHLRSFQGGFAHSSIEGITSPAYTVMTFKNKEKHNDIFWKYVFISEDFIKRLELITYGIRDGRSISFEEFTTLFMICPNACEQKRIGSLFAALDRTIDLQRRKLEKLQTFKSSMLQKMFPKEGSLTPEIRFRGFQGEWKQQIIGKISKVTKGAGFSKKDLVPKGTPIVLYGRLYTDYQTIITRVDTFVVDNSNSYHSKGNEVVIPASGETAEDIARASHIKVPNVIIGSDLHIIIPSEECDPSFLALHVSSGTIQMRLAQKAQGKTIVHLQRENIEDTLITITSKKEQERIVALCSTLDRTIDLLRRKLEKLQNLKQSLLQKMFV